MKDEYYHHCKRRLHGVYLGQYKDSPIDNTNLVGRGATCNVYMSKDSPNTVIKVLNDEGGNPLDDKHRNRERTANSITYDFPQVCENQGYYVDEDDRIKAFRSHYYESKTLFESKEIGTVMLDDCPKQSMIEIVDLLTGIIFINDAGLMHRDIKPGSIFMSKDSKGDEWCFIGGLGCSKFNSVLN